MSNEINTCKSVLTLEQYLDSCPIFLSKPSALSGLSKLTSASIIGGGGDYSLASLKNSFENNGFIEYIKHPQDIFKDSSRLPSLESYNTAREEPSKVFQGLWITNVDNPKSIDYNLLNFIEQSKKLEGYETVIWSNIESNKLKEMNPLLESENITVKNLIDIKTQYPQLVDFILSPKNYININNAHSFNGLIIDVAKYIIIESQGGILADLNFEFDDSFKQDSIKSYDFIADLKRFGNIENGFFISKPNHIIFKELLDIVDEMINNPECSLKELRDTGSTDTITDLFSMMPLVMAYIKSNNLEGNIDVLIDGCTKGIQKKGLPDIETIRSHEEMAYKLESSDFEGDFRDYVASYTKTILHRGVNYSCIEDPIGEDNNMSITWWGAEIV